MYFNDVHIFLIITRLSGYYIKPNVYILSDSMFLEGAI